eukprot:1157228-Pleurochrysis_carterae.AAC.2
MQDTSMSSDGLAKMRVSKGGSKRLWATRSKRGLCIDRHLLTLPTLRQTAYFETLQNGTFLETWQPLTQSDVAVDKVSSR